MVLKLDTGVEEVLRMAGGGGRSLLSLTGRMRGQKDLINIINQSNGTPFRPTLVFLSQ